MTILKWAGAKKVIPTYFELLFLLVLRGRQPNLVTLSLLALKWLFLRYEEWFISLSCYLVKPSTLGISLSMEPL